MAIFNFGEVFGQLRDEMAKSRKTKADEAKVSTYVSRLTGARPIGVFSRRSWLSSRTRLLPQPPT